MKPTLDQPYSKQFPDLRRMDLFQPDRPNGAAILFIHGGGWRNGSRKNWHPAMEYFCGRGYVCASVSYRLLPEHRFPAAFEDVRLAMAWFRTQAAGYGADSRRIGVWGSSAGSHLAALLATVPPDDGLGLTGEITGRETRPAAVAAYCGLYSLERGWMSPDLGRGVDEFLGGTEAETAESTRAASPMLRVRGGEPPFILITGERDELIPPAQQAFMAEALRRHGVEVETHIVPGAGHGLGYGVQHPQQRQNADQVDRFFERHLLKRLT